MSARLEAAAPGLVIKVERVLERLTQTEVAAVAGVSRHRLSRIETGRSELSPATAAHLRRAIAFATVLRAVGCLGSWPEDGVVAEAIEARAAGVMPLLPHRLTTTQRLTAARRLLDAWQL